MIFWFTGLAIAAVGKTAGEVVREVRRQLRENPGIMEYKEKPDYRACVSLVTKVRSRGVRAGAEKSSTRVPPVGLNPAFLPRGLALMWYRVPPKLRGLFEASRCMEDRRLTRVSRIAYRVSCNAAGREGRTRYFVVGGSFHPTRQMCAPFAVFMGATRPVSRSN